MKRNGARKPKSHMVSFRIDEDYLARLDALVRQTSYSRAEVLRRCLVGAPLKSTVDAQALIEVARVHADLNRIGGLLKLAIREGVSDPSSYHRLSLELIDSVMDVRRAVNRLAGQRSIIATLPVNRRDREQLLQQLALRQAIEARALKRKLAIQRKAIQKIWHPGTWPGFVATRAAERDARAIRLVQQRERRS